MSAKLINCSIALLTIQQYDNRTVEQYNLLLEGGAKNENKTIRRSSYC